jgi:photosystem II stability/assembly factor-like uncharacterized protein
MDMKSTTVLTRVLSALRPGGALLLTACLLWALPVQASNDPLELPALVSSKAAHAMLLGVARADSRLVAVGERGVIVYSDNQGQSWTQASVPVSVTLTAVQFIGAQQGWAVGHDGVVLSTTDGGQTWVKRFDGNQANSLMLADMEKVAADAHRAADTATGAAKKAAQASQDAADNAVGDVQAGAKFGPSRPLLGLYFKSENEGWVVGAFGQIFHTADGGAKWESLAGRLHNMDGLHYNAITSTPSGALVIAGEGGKLYRSRDNGATWQTLDTGYKGQLYGVLGLPGDGSGEGGGESLLAYGFAGHVLLGAKDDSNWQALPLIAHKNLVGGLRTVDGGIVLAGQDGAVLLSADNGKSFTLLQPGSGLEIAGMALLGKNGEKIALSGVDGVHVVAVANAGRLK